MEMIYIYYKDYVLNCDGPPSGEEGGLPAPQRITPVLLIPTRNQHPSEQSPIQCQTHHPNHRPNHQTR